MDGGINFPPFTLFLGHISIAAHPIQNTENRNASMTELELKDDGFYEFEFEVVVEKGTDRWR